MPAQLRLPASPSPTPTPTGHRPLRPRRRAVRGLLVLAVGAALLTTAGCADASETEPEQKSFPFDGHRLDVRHDHLPTDLVAADIDEIRVTRWFDTGMQAGRKTFRWELDGSTLHLDASCSGLADCDTKFRVEVPRDVTVLRNGKPTDLKG